MLMNIEMLNAHVYNNDHDNNDHDMIHDLYYDNMDDR